MALYHLLTAPKSRVLAKESSALIDSEGILKVIDAIRALCDVHDGLIGRLVHVAYRHGRKVDARIGVIRRLDRNENRRRLPLAPGAHDEEHGRAEADQKQRYPNEPAPVYQIKKRKNEA